MLSSVGLLIALTAMNAVFASAEIAVISTNETRLKMLADEGNRAAKRLIYLTKQPAKFLATIQVAITLAGLLSSAFAAENFAGPLTAYLISVGVPVAESVLRPIALMVITVILAYFNLIFGELVPKRVAMKRAEPLALALSGLLYLVAKCFAPLVALLTVSTNLVLRLMGMNPEEEDDTVSEEEIRMMLAQGKLQGSIKHHENEIIQNIFEFDDITAEQLCTHRTDLYMLDVEEFETWDEKICNSRYTYYPVYSCEKDNVVGILSAKKYFRLQDRTNKAQVLKKTLTKPLFLLKSMKADKVFAALQTAHQGLALLVDEHGGLYGMVTLHDLLEALVGNLDYEAHPDEEPIRKVGENLWRISGMTALSAVAKALDVRLPSDDHETLNGMIYQLLGYVPKDGDTPECTGYGLVFQVKLVQRHRVEYALVSKQEQPAEEPAE